MLVFYRTVLVTNIEHRNRNLYAYIPGFPSGCLLEPQEMSITIPVLPRIQVIYGFTTAPIDKAVLNTMPARLIPILRYLLPTETSWKEYIIEL